MTDTSKKLASEETDDTFDARIDLTGIFRFCRHEKDGKERVVALAPWTGPPIDRERHIYVEPEERHFHRFMVAWWPHDLGHQNMPPNAISFWQVPGMQLRFEVERADGEASSAEGKDADDTQPDCPQGSGAASLPSLHRQLDDLRIPSMVPNGQPQAIAARSIVPEELRALAGIHRPLLETPVGKFAPVPDLEVGYSTHLGFKGNQEGLAGRVIIDDGELVTDDLTSHESVFLPSLYGSGAEPCKGFFTNQVSVIFRRVESVTIVAENLITGATVGRLELVARPNRCKGSKICCTPRERDRYLLISIMHLCPDTLLAECPDPMLKPKPQRDEDFLYLYELSVDPKRLRCEMRRLLGGCPGRLPVPTQQIDYHSCRPSKCGPCSN